ncbi:hypothetical protein K458DRAFT_195508 [Lentithecium fluviatile CBS 122367]|uniref:Uncharacterized protein n=1 Tax=Lentithecium fluviatile CBS 122367 TaxID=1168545 RepID=A0A6G1ID88_9PLEO|nr:hypothetical protein K458DRAFT_195508 [Lentithecium fluviatile CBS 122367]
MLLGRAHTPASISNRPTAQEQTAASPRRSPKTDSPVSGAARALPPSPFLKRKPLSWAGPCIHRRLVCFDRPIRHRHYPCHIQGSDRV